MEGADAAAKTKGIALHSFTNGGLGDEPRKSVEMSLVLARRDAAGTSVRATSDIRRSEDAAGRHCFCGVSGVFFVAGWRKLRSTISLGSVETGPSRHSHRIISGRIMPLNFCPWRFILHE
jgi:hypothetical protein